MACHLNNILFNLAAYVTGIGAHVTVCVTNFYKLYTIIIELHVLFRHRTYQSEDARLGQGVKISMVDFNT